MTGLVGAFAAARGMDAGLEASAALGGVPTGLCLLLLVDGLGERSRRLLPVAAQRVIPPGDGAGDVRVRVALGFLFASRCEGGEVAGVPLPEQRVRITAGAPATSSSRYACVRLMAPPWGRGA
ncbi:hypothetical protein [Streptomyces niveus]|uniref:hypothetical protein n=1 Tax=Streptomyces niveus TaxID=193462 RepID=UPI0036D24480